MTAQSFKFRNAHPDRRHFLHASARAAALLGAGSYLPWLAGQNAEHADLYSSADLRPLTQMPGKVPLILLTDRPPQLETPLEYFRQDLTPNNAFFVRWHLSGIPKSIDERSWKLELGGAVNKALSFTLAELKRQFEPMSLVAVNQCSGNSRSLFSPRVPGGQWRHGAMGNARWKGVRLKDLLDRAGVKAGAKDVTFRGLDKAPLPATPAFEKALSIDRATSADVMVAYEMNGQPLPMLNGFPVRLVVPGWYATYWVKALSSITVRDEPFHNFWTDKAYRIPNNPKADERPGQLIEDTVPINRIAVHSIFVDPSPGQSLRRGRAIALQGLALDGGAGIKSVELSFDSGKTWSSAKLGADLGNYSWRRWRTMWTPAERGVHRLMVRATNNSGETQVNEQWNHSGYQRNLIEHMDVEIA